MWPAALCALALAFSKSFVASALSFFALSLASSTME
jgi:hypothetical protein